MFENQNICNHREKNESYKEYKKRLKINSKQIKDYLKGNIIFNSSEGKTFIKNKH